MITPTAIVEFKGSYNSTCGYCHEKQNKSRVCHGMFLLRCPVELYEQLWERNWRRSGDWYYQPQNNKTCCPQYGIRCDSTTFQPTKHHKKISRKFNRYLTGDWSHEGNKMDVEPENFAQASLTEQIQNHLSQCVANVLESLEQKDPDHAFLKEWKRSQLVVKVNLKKQQKRREDEPIIFFTNVAMVLMGHLKKEKVAVSRENTENFARLVASALSELDLKVKGVDQISVSEKNSFINFDVMAPNMHEKKAVPSNMEQKPSVRREFKTKMVDSVFDQESFEVYRKYQVAVHGDKYEEVTEKGYTRFLCTSTIVQEKGKKAPFSGYGTYHLQYRIDGKLIGVSVVDVLKKGLSSVYFFYDPDYSFLSLGVYSALHELELIRQESTKFKEFKYYYLGYYIHNCEKMKYKAQYRPCEMLCPVTYRWTSAEIAIPKLDKQKYCQFYEPIANEIVEDEAKSVSVNDILLLINQTLYTLRSLREYESLDLSSEVITGLEEFIKCCGKSATRVLYYVDTDDLILLEK